MTVDRATLIAIAPELKVESATRVAIFLEAATLRVNRTVFGLKSDLATVLLAAHMMTLSNRGGIGGAVQSEKIGDVAQTFAVASGNKDGDELMTTAYGQQYLSLRRSLPRTPLVV